MKTESAQSQLVDDVDHIEHEHGRHVSAWRQLTRLLRGESRDLWTVGLFAVAVGLFTLATPIVAMAVVNTVALGTLLQQLVVLCVALFVALFVAGTLQLLQSVVVEYLQRRIFVRVASDLAWRLPKADVRAFDRHHGPELVNRFFDVLTVQKAAATLLLDGVMIVLQIIIGLALLGYYSRALLGFDLILIFCLIVLLFVLGRGAVRTAIAESVAKYQVAGWLEEVARHPIAFKMYGGPALARARTEEFLCDYLKFRGSHFRILCRQYGFALFLQAAANVALLGIGGLLVVDGQLTLGELVAAEIVLTLVVATFTKLGKQLEAFYDLLAAADKLGHVIDIPLERTTGAIPPANAGGARVVLHAVQFQYDAATRPAVAGFDMILKPGERVALVGPNGVGKSTIADLLYGLRVPSHGWIEYDGADLRDLSLPVLREQVALVKNVEVFEGTILENVSTGRDFVGLAEVRNVLDRLGLLKAISSLPDGLNTWLGTGGTPLSVGQTERLMIARAIVGRPRLLILDEALDHMDAEVRDAVIDHVLSADMPWTALIVTHSPIVASRCGRVVMMPSTAIPNAETEEPR